MKEHKAHIDSCRDSAVEQCGIQFIGRHASLTRVNHSSRVQCVSTVWCKAVCVCVFVEPCECACQWRSRPQSSSPRCASALLSPMFGEFLLCSQPDTNMSYSPSQVQTDYIINRRLTNWGKMSKTRILTFQEILYYSMIVIMMMLLLDIFFQIKNKITKSR